jgi:hypothetical protein
MRKVREQGLEIPFLLSFSLGLSSTAQSVILRDMMKETYLPLKDKQSL